MVISEMDDSPRTIGEKNMKWVRVMNEINTLIYMSENVWHKSPIGWAPPIKSAWTWMLNYNTTIQSIKYAIKWELNHEIL